MALDWSTVKRYAPALKFYKASTEADSFPVDPDVFLAGARLRRYGWNDQHPDAWFDPAAENWVPKQPKTGKALTWSGVLQAIDTDAAPHKCGLDPGADVTRPADKRNLWTRKDGSLKCGFALELADPESTVLKGRRDSPAPVFVDQVTIEQGGVTLDAILYWVFYAANPNRLGGWHEGDWEHISVLFAPGKAQPLGVFFAAHEHGETARWEDLSLIDDSHPVVFVERESHASSPKVFSAEKFYELAPWETWKGQLVSLADTPFYRFDGAWGKVDFRIGHNDVTGPLGPFFKRSGDKVDLKALRLKKPS